MTIGQAPPPTSEYPTTQPVNQLVAIPRTISCSFEHLALDGIGSLHGFQVFAESTGLFSRAAQIEQKTAGLRSGARPQLQVAVPSANW
jgi:hypothetical protein